MNATLPRLHSDPRSPAMASPLPDMPVVRGAHIAPNLEPQGFAPFCGAFNPGRDGAVGMGGPRARRADAANALRKWMFDPTPDQLGACARDSEASEETQAIDSPTPDATDTTDESDDWPVKQRVRPWGTWRSRAKPKQPANPFSGLLR